MTDTQTIIREHFQQSGIILTAHQLGQFARYFELIREHNESLDLTRLTSPHDIIVKHFVDSVYFTEFIELPSPLLDIGTGGGFPGIPLKIFIPELRIILSEPRKKRASFLEKAVKEMGLSGVDVYPHMVTGLSDFSVRGVITRALEPVDDTLTRVGHFLPRDGRAIFMKGPEAGADLDAISDANRESYSLESDRSYTLPLTDYRRRIIVFKKISGTTTKTYAILKDLTATAGTAISSAENRQFKELKKLTESGGVRKSGKVLVSGKKIITEIMKNNADTAKEMIVRDEYPESDGPINDILKMFAARGSLLVLKKSLFNEIDSFNSGGPLMTVATPEMEEWDQTAGPGCTLLLPFQDPANIGSAIRSAAGFKVKRIVILKEAANPYHPKSIRSSAGAVFGVQLLKGPSLYDLPAVTRPDTAIIALDVCGEPLASFTFPERFLLLTGIEGPGLPEELKARSISIPLDGGVESLNASVALSIALYEWNRHSPSN